MYVCICESLSYKNLRWLPRLHRVMQHRARAPPQQAQAMQHRSISQNCLGGPGHGMFISHGLHGRRPRLGLGLLGGLGCRRVPAVVRLRAALQQQLFACAMWVCAICLSVYMYVCMYVFIHTPFHERCQPNLLP